MTKRPVAFTFYERGWIVRVQPPADPKSQHAMLMLHGWTGDENVMSIFGQSVPEFYWLISPRGPVNAEPSGFGWLGGDSLKNARYSDYAVVTDELDLQVDHWIDYLRISTESLDIMGFSQGGALALCYLLRHPDRIRRAACLAGFLPPNAEKVLHPQSLSGKTVLIAHGSLDKTVPIEQANLAATALRSAGAEVVFCQDEVGHKLGSGCYKGLETFFNM
ncbi:MAG TPA: alpha/beta fold hydrolase [Longilinea sp.]|nr:alpha/beta fold hydrolase [Longilinea sp.]